LPDFELKKDKVLIIIREQLFQLLEMKFAYILLWPIVEKEKMRKVKQKENIIFGE
jgi:hypothetical protein